LLLVEHIGCFLGLAIVNSAAINMVHRCLCCKLTCIPSGISLGEVLVDHMADLCLVF
jgi:hypothetical protein